MRKLSCFFFVILRWNIKMQGRACAQRDDSSFRQWLHYSGGFARNVDAENGWKREREREGWTRRWLFDGVRESLKSFTMDCDGPGWRFIGDSRDVRRRNQVSAGLRSRLETVSAARPAPFILLFLRGRRKKKEQSGKYHHLYSCWIFPSSFRTETSLEMNGGQTYYDRRLKTRTSN